MATLTKITKFRRKLRRKKMGAERKARMENHGSTPPFPVHTPEAHANAPKEQLPKDATSND